MRNEQIFAILLTIYETSLKNAKICSKKERNWLVKMFEILSKRLASLQISDYGGSSQETVQPRGEKCYLYGI